MAAAPARTRDRFLDVVRAVALVRVVAWHTWGAPLLSWLVAAMPAMFFVTGSLLAASLDRRPVRAVVADRLRRLLVPFWVFGAVAHAAMATAWWWRPGEATRIPWWQPLAWLLPVVDPVGTPWEATWLSRPLWYLRVVLWLLAAAPVLRWAQRRWGLALCAVPAALTVAAEVAAGRGWLADHPLVRFHLTDVVTYATFLLLGFWHHDGGTRRLTVGTRWAASGAGAAAALAWALWRGPDSWIVNDSPVLLLTVGWAWLWAYLALERPLGAAGSGPRLGQVVDWLSRRSMTVYLWHTTAIVGAYAIVDHLPLHAIPAVRVTATAVAVALGVVLAATLLGWVEDHTARRPRRWPGARTVAAAVTVALVWGGVALAPGDGDATAFVPPPPSARPPELVFETTPSSVPEVETVYSAVAAPPPTTVAPTSTSTTIPLSMEDRVELALRDFAREWGDEGIAGVAFTADRRRQWSGAVSADGDDPPFRPDDIVLAASITKSVTSVLAHQLADEGRLDLDAPIRAIDGVPTWPGAAGITPRHLLEHSSGIISYTEARRYDKKGRYGPRMALQLALTEPLRFPAGSRKTYSNSGYLALGLVLEQTTGRPFEQMAEDRVFTRLGMASADIHVTPEAGFIGHASGGMRSDLHDLARLVRGVYREGVLVSHRSFERMLPTRDRGGLGIAGFCPCDGATGRIAAVGHDGGVVSARLFRDVGVIVVLRFTEGIYDTKERRDAVYALDHRVAKLVAGAE